MHCVYGQIRSSVDHWLYSLVNGDHSGQTHTHLCVSQVAK